jgi:hypothetical protein
MKNGVWLSESNQEGKNEKQYFGTDRILRLGILEIIYFSLPKAFGAKGSQMISKTGTSR